MWTGRECFRRRQFGGGSRLPPPSLVNPSRHTLNQLPIDVTDGRFAVNPMDPETETSLPQCKAVSFTWQGAYQGPVSIIGVIPGGMVFGGAPSSGSEICELVGARDQYCAARHANTRPQRTQ